MPSTVSLFRMHWFPAVEQVRFSIKIGRQIDDRLIDR